MSALLPFRGVIMELQKEMWIARELYFYNIGPAKLKRMSMDELVKVHRQLDIQLDELLNFIKELKEKLKPDIVNLRMREIGDRFFVVHCLCSLCINGSAKFYQAKADAQEALNSPYVSIHDRYNPPICAEGD